MIGSEIVIDLNGFFEQCGTPATGWYVGVASDAEQSLFNHHQVSRHFDSWIYRVADSSEIARNVQRVFLEQGCDGERDIDESKGIMVYAYQKSATTSP